MHFSNLSPLITLYSSTIPWYQECSTGRAKVFCENAIKSYPKKFGKAKVMENDKCKNFETEFFSIKTGHVENLPETGPFATYLASLWQPRCIFCGRTGAASGTVESGQGKKNPSGWRGNNPIMLLFFLFYVSSG
jgi:hypothetical protein